MARRTLAWGILGTGRIARKLAAAIKASSTGHLAAVGSRSLESAKAFAQEFGIPRAFGSYDDIVNSTEVEAVYVSLPNHLHAEWTSRCAVAGKHILCEKPFTVNRLEAERVIATVRESKVFLLEAFMYRFHPLIARLVEIVRNGDIGEVRMMQGNFSYNMGLDLANIRLSHAAAGGGIMDVGCYPISMARLVAGAARGNPFLNPVEVRGSAHLGERSRVDEQAVGTMKFPGGCVAALACGTQVAIDNTFRIWGSEGHISIPVPWHIPEHNARMVVQRQGESAPAELLVDAPGSIYTLQIDAVAAAIKRHDIEVKAPGMTWADTLGNMAALDAWRASVGLIFEGEG
jgi:predicted dehydrogenase